MRRPLYLLSLLALLACLPVQAAPLKPRPFSGIGVLTLAQKAPLVVYAEPGVQRIAEFSPSQLPLLARSNQELMLSTAGAKGGWLRIAYDEAGREGWIETDRSWRFLPWDDFLPGRAVKLLPALKKGLYVVRGGPGEGGELRGTLNRDQTVRVLAVNREWAQIESPPGWFRWRDGDGRLTVALEGALSSEKR